MVMCKVMGGVGWGGLRMEGGVWIVDMFSRVWFVLCGVDAGTYIVVSCD